MCYSRKNIQEHITTSSSVKLLIKQLIFGLGQRAGFLLLAAQFWTGILHETLYKFKVAELCFFTCEWFQLRLQHYCQEVSFSMLVTVNRDCMAHLQK